MIPKEMIEAAAMKMYEQHGALYPQQLPPWRDLLDWQKKVWLDRALDVLTAALSVQKEEAGPLAGTGMVQLSPCHREPQQPGPPLDRESGKSEISSIWDDARVQWRGMESAERIAGYNAGLEDAARHCERNALSAIPVEIRSLKRPLPPPPAQE